MSLTIHSKYKYFDSTVQRVEDRRQKFHFCRLPFAVNVVNLSINFRCADFNTDSADACILVMACVDCARACT